MKKLESNDSKKPMTYNFVCFSDLAYEFHDDDKNEIQKKIKRRLKYYELGKYEQNRIEYIRKLKKELYLELSNPIKSKYYKKTESEFAHPSDFDIGGLKEKYQKIFPEIQEEDFWSILNFAIYLFYLR